MCSNQSNRKNLFSFAKKKKQQKKQKKKKKIVFIFKFISVSYTNMTCPTNEKVHTHVETKT